MASGTMVQAGAELEPSGEMQPVVGASRLGTGSVEPRLSCVSGDKNSATCHIKA